MTPEESAQRFPGLRELAAQFQRDFMQRRSVAAQKIAWQWVDAGCPAPRPVLYIDDVTGEPLSAEEVERRRNST